MSRYKRCRPHVDVHHSNDNSCTMKTSVNVSLLAIVACFIALASVTDAQVKLFLIIEASVSGNDKDSTIGSYLLCVSISVARFGKISPLGQNFESLGNLLRVYLVSGEILSQL